MPVIDTHCHLDLIEERGLAAAEVLKKAAEAEVHALVQIATNLKSSQNNQKLSKENTKGTGQRPQIYWTAGLHPGNANELSSLDDIFSLIQENHNNPDFIGDWRNGIRLFPCKGSQRDREAKREFCRSS